jgi:hypothetical protein
MKTILVAAIALLSLTIFGSSGWAQSEDSQQGIAPTLRANSFFTLVGSISGTFIATPTTLPSGACSGGTAGFAAVCATGHTCSCLEEEGAKFTSTVIGKGTANVFITVDETAGYGLPVVSNPDHPTVCHPFVAEFDVTTKSDTEELEAVGGETLRQTTLQYGGAFGAEATTLFTDEAGSFILTQQSDSSFRMPFTATAANFE